jgi:thiamine-monophosphate kinase
MRDAESKLIARIRSRLWPHRGVLVDSGDDCAIVRMGRQAVLFKIDQTVEGVHFRLAEIGPAGAGRKALARVLSDFAAMGGAAQFAVAGVVLPAHMRAAQVYAIWRGMEPLARRFQCRLVGGDISSHRGPLVITVAAIGASEGRPFLRSGARPGHALLMTGRLGRSHWRFVPRLSEARALRRYRIGGMIDISDGFALDLHRLCSASGVGAIVLRARVPGSWTRGEDHELLFTAPPEDAARIARAGLARVIGQITRTRRIIALERDGRKQQIEPRGWIAFGSERR